jgi:molybdenum cofactor cytidylyltransferase
MKAVSSNSSNTKYPPVTRFSAIILAAGNSGRMGSDKALLAFDNNTSFIEHLVNSYFEHGADPVVIVMNENFIQSGTFNKKPLFVLNSNVEKGRSHSIKLGLSELPQSSACFLQNVDNPYADIELLSTMLFKLEPGSFIVPVIGDRGGHPVLISTEIIDYVTSLNNWNDFRVVLRRFQRIQVPWKDHKILLNINTPEEYMSFRLNNGNE